MAKTEEQLVELLREVTGRVDSSDPLFTDTKMLGYITDFVELISTQDVRLFKNYSWWEFTFGPADANPLPVDLQLLGYSTIGPIAYVDGFKLFWYESPGDFFYRWPETQTYQPQRPTDVLYYNQELLFRGPPEKEYTVKIQTYNVEIQFVDGIMKDDYMFRYVVYGAALDLFSDYGEDDRWDETYKKFKRYRALVYSRTWSQYQSQRPDPSF